MISPVRGRLTALLWRLVHRILTSTALSLVAIALSTTVHPGAAIAARSCRSTSCLVAVILASLQTTLGHELVATKMEALTIVTVLVWILLAI